MRGTRPHQLTNTPCQLSSNGFECSLMRESFFRSWGVTPATVVRRSRSAAVRARRTFGLVAEDQEVEDAGSDEGAARRDLDSLDVLPQGVDALAVPIRLVLALFLRLPSPKGGGVGPSSGAPKPRTGRRGRGRLLVVDGLLLLHLLLEAAAGPELHDLLHGSRLLIERARRDEHPRHRLQLRRGFRDARIFNVLGRHGLDRSAPPKAAAGRGRGLLAPAPARPSSVVLWVTNEGGGAMRRSCGERRAAATTRAAWRDDAPYQRWKAARSSPRPLGCPARRTSKTKTRGESAAAARVPRRRSLCSSSDGRPVRGGALASFSCRRA